MITAGKMVTQKLLNNLYQYMAFSRRQTKVSHGKDAVLQVADTVAKVEEGQRYEQ